MSKTATLKSRKPAPVPVQPVVRRLTVLQMMMLADAARDGKYQCATDELRTASCLEQKGLGTLWHDMFEISQAGRAALEPPNNADERTAGPRS